MNTKTQLIIVAGLAGVGKSRLAGQLARRLNYAYLDKDTLASPLVNELLAALNSPLGRSDRDTDIYASRVRPAEYACLRNTAMENVKLGISTVMVAPFLREINDPLWREALEKECRSIGSGEVLCCFVWVHCHPDTMRRRLIERNSDRDARKLAEWDAYLGRLADLKPPLSPFLEIDTSRDDDTENAVAKIVDWLSKNRKGGHDKTCPYS